LKVARYSLLLWLALVSATIAVVFFSLPLIGGLVTPGPLSKAHANLESNCLACHVPFAKPQQDSLCKGCHEEVAHDLTAGEGYHGRNPVVREQACASCHTDHEGRDVELVSFDAESFDHLLTDFRLTGAHETLECLSCHQPEERFASAPLTCVGCHSEDDAHKGNLGPQCEGCHNTATWNETSAFDHSLTGFALVGKHVEVECESCHTNKRFHGTPSDCVSCHKKDDVHRGGNGDQCEECHVARGWEFTNFDHDLETRFPLRGAHAQVACNVCHKQPAALVALPITCNECHKSDDVHRGRLGAKCDSCHGNATWTPASLFDHSGTEFPLTGRHAAISCSECHKDKLFSSRVTSCIGCHADTRHQGRFGKAPDCATCHVTSSWQRWTFDHAKQAGFALDGKHASLTCYQCHGKPVASAKMASSCVDCHRADDSHRGEFGENCQRCHSTESWKGAGVPKTRLRP
jgi:hypothetical protein